MKKEIICTVCPRGCHIMVEGDGEKVLSAEAAWPQASQIFMVLAASLATLMAAFWIAPNSPPKAPMLWALNCFWLCC